MPHEATMDTASAIIPNDLKSSGISRILISAQQIQDEVLAMARELDQEYVDDQPLVICVLRGAVAFMADLVKAMTIPLEMDFMAVSSYGAATKSSGVVRILKDLDEEISGRRLIIVEDIVDSGLTLDYLLRSLRARGPASIKVCGLLVKEREREHTVPIDYIGFTIPDRFVVGYGLDFAEKYRNLPYIGVLRPELYETSETDAPTEPSPIPG